MAIIARTLNQMLILVQVAFMHPYSLHSVACRNIMHINVGREQPYRIAGRPRHRLQAWIHA